MRTRVFQNEFVPGYYKVADEYVSRGVNLWAGTAVTMYPKSQKFMAMVDIVTPRFKSKRNQGEIVNNPMWKVVYQRAEKPTIVSGKGDDRSCASFWKLGWIPSVGVVLNTANPVATINDLCASYSSESEIAQTKAWANIDLSEMQAWASMGEFPETVKMIADILKVVYRSFFAVRRGDVGNLRKELKALKNFHNHAADLWLMWRYGVRPLIGEIQALLKILSMKPLVGKRQTFRGKHTFDGTQHPTETYSHKPWSAKGAGWDFKTKVIETRSYRAGVMVQIESDINSAAAILGLDNPISGAYELIPCSFILDWFFNVGDTIAAMVGNPSLSPVCSFVTEEVTSTTIANYYGYSQFPDSEPCQQQASANGSLLVEPGYVNTFITVKRRIPLAKRYNLPHLNLKLDAAKLLDLALIARQLLK